RVYTSYVCFFFQAEDGIRYRNVTGVQTCALPISMKVYRFPPDFDRSSFDTAYSPGSRITHRVPVRRNARAKRAAMRAHASQASGGEGDRTLGVLSRLPWPLFGLVLGREWFVEPAAGPTGHPATDVFEVAT